MLNTAMCPIDVPAIASGAGIGESFAALAARSARTRPRQGAVGGDYETAMLSWPRFDNSRTAALVHGDRAVIRRSLRGLSERWSSPSLPVSAPGEGVCPRPCSLRVKPFQRVEGVVARPTRGASPALAVRRHLPLAVEREHTDLIQPCGAIGTFVGGSNRHVTEGFRGAGCVGCPGDDDRGGAAIASTGTRE